MTRAVLVLAFLAPGAALAADAWPAAGSDVGPDPWAVAMASPAFGPEDAYLFADPDLSLRLDREAEEAASLVDRERLAERPTPFGRSETGRVAAAFSDFVSYGPAGGSYASVALARADGGVTRIALATPAAASFALAGR